MCTECPDTSFLLGAQRGSEQKEEVISRQGSAFGCLFWGTGENSSHVIVILGEMGKGEVREKVASKSHTPFGICSDYSCRYLGWCLTGR